MPSAVATTPMRQQTGEARLIVPRQPAVHRIGVTFLQQTMFGYPARTAAEAILRMAAQRSRISFGGTVGSSVHRPPSTVRRHASRRVNAATDNGGSSKLA